MAYTSSQAGGRRDFVDRRQHFEQFESILASKADLDACRVFVWYGPGGQGKTALRSEMEERVKSFLGHEGMTVSALDFTNSQHRSPIDALLYLRADLAHRAGISFT